MQGAIAEENDMQAKSTYTVIKRKLFSQAVENFWTSSTVLEIHKNTTKDLQKLKKNE